MKKGYFFTMDAIIGMMMLIVGFFLILSIFVSEPYEQQLEVLANDWINFMDDYEIQLLDPIQFEDIHQLNISNKSTLLEAAAYFCEKDDPANARLIIEKTTSGLLKKQLGYQVKLKDYNSTKECVIILQKDPLNAQVLISAKDIIYFEDNGLKGPWIGEVWVWQ